MRTLDVGGHVTALARLAWRRATGRRRADRMRGPPLALTWDGGSAELAVAGLLPTAC